MSQTKPVIKHPGLLIIRDGWGISDKLRGNAVKLADPKCYKRLLNQNYWTSLEPGGEAVGLPEGQMGNSEVGHMNIGSGRTVYQDLPRINRDLETGEFEKQQNMAAFLKQSINRGRVHLLGLVSDGGVHSHQNHFYGVLKLLKKAGIDKVFVHVITDGRDTFPESGADYIATLEEKMNLIGVGEIATISGRYYAMDRDKNWDRTKKAYDAIVLGKGEYSKSSKKCIEDSYVKGITDEFIEPTVINTEGCIQSGDAALFMNFRPDRARQISFALENNNFTHFNARELNLHFTIMTPYSSELTVPVIYTKKNLGNTLAEVFCNKGMRQFKIAETEKYAHITYFMNGGHEKEFDGEKHQIIPSPKVATYDLKPEMSAEEVTKALLGAIDSYQYDFLAVNYANPDMVGHTGNLEAAIKAVSIVDDCVEQLLKAMASVGGSTFITADHGNLDEMIDHNTGQVLTNHSLNQVDFIHVPRPGDKRFGKLKSGGKLADIAPTMLHALDVEIPSEMDGDILFE
tara:strand:+ start:781 stop:2322 length:1542 start_codon:yes stop_codon:yes gene_type:complete